MLEKTEYFSNEFRQFFFKLHSVLKEKAFATNFEGYMGNCHI